MSPLSSAPTTVTVGHARERVNKVISRKTVSTHSPDFTTFYIGDPDSSKHHPRDLLVRALSGCGKDGRSHTGSFWSGFGIVTPAHRLSVCACRHAGAHKDALSTSHALLSRRRGGFFFFFSLPTGFHQASPRMRAGTPVHTGIIDLCRYTCVRAGTPAHTRVIKKPTA